MTQQILVREPIISKELVDLGVDVLDSGDTLASLRVVGSEWQRVDAKAISIDGTVFEASEISSSKLKKASVSDVIFRDCLLFGTDFDGSGFLRVVFERGMLSGLAVTDCSLQDVIFEGGKLNLVNFRASKLKRVVFRHCDLTEADFQGASLTDVKLENCNLNNTEFSNTKMSKVDMRGSEISTIRGASSLRGVTISSPQLVSIARVLAEEVGLIIAD